MPAKAACFTTNGSRNAQGFYSFSVCLVLGNYLGSCLGVNTLTTQDYRSRTTLESVHCVRAEQCDRIPKVRCVGACSAALRRQTSQSPSPVQSRACSGSCRAAFEADLCSPRGNYPHEEPLRVLLMLVASKEEGTRHQGLRHCAYAQRLGISDLGIHPVVPVCCGEGLPHFCVRW